METSYRTEAMKIEPTVGCVMWFYPYRGSTQPLAATVACVNHDGSVNIGFLTSYGNHDSKIHVRVVQENEKPPKDEPFVCWISYQVCKEKKNLSDPPKWPNDL